jgi:hypothetical protein
MFFANKRSLAQFTAFVEGIDFKLLPSGKFIKILKTIIFLSWNDKKETNVL